MNGTRRRLRLPLFGAGILSTALLMAVGATPAGTAPAAHSPKFTKAVAFDASKPLRELAKAAHASARQRLSASAPSAGRPPKTLATRGTPPSRPRPGPQRRSKARSRTSKAWASRTTSTSSLAA